MRKLLSILGLSAGLVFADPQFDVATIRPSDGGPGGFVPGVRNGRFRTTKSSLKTLIGFAYSIPEMQISGPDWIASQTFDLTATLPASAEPDQAPAMLRALLEERFHLRVHRESAEMSYYALGIAKGGFKLKPLQPGDPIPPVYGPGTPPSKGMTTLMNNGALADFAQSLARVMGRPVVDKTALAGRFFMFIRYAGPNATEPGPDILTAIQEQLGLKINAHKGPVEILKVDSLDKMPTDN